MTGLFLRVFTRSLGAGLLGMLIICAGGARAWADPSDASQQSGAPAAGDNSASLNDYRLGQGDKVRITVYGETDLSGEFDVTGTGKLSMPLIGQVQATGLTLDQLQAEITNSLAQGYLKDPKVSAEVLNYRPFYIIGEVDKPGQYPYTNGMTVLNAVAVAGGFTYRANTDDVYITHEGGKEAQYSVNDDIKVLPGDIVRVPERFF